MRDLIEMRAMNRMQGKSGKALKINAKKVKRTIICVGVAALCLALLPGLFNGRTGASLEAEALASGQLRLQKIQSEPVAAAQAKVDARIAAQEETQEAFRQAEIQRDEQKKEEREAAERKKREAAQKKQTADVRVLRKQFKNSVVVGDSITEALAGYGFLPRNNVVSKFGISVEEADEEITTVINLAPEHIFLAFGMNDLPYFLGNASDFITQYERQIARLREALPNSKIYVNSILPVQQSAIDKNEYFAHYPEFNAALQEMCSRLDLPFIDNSVYVAGREDMYKEDGIHVASNYYLQWIQHMVQVAAL